MLSIQRLLSDVASCGDGDMKLRGETLCDGFESTLDCCINYQQAGYCIEPGPLLELISLHGYCRKTCGFCDDSIDDLLGQSSTIHLLDPFVTTVRATLLLFVASIAGGLFASFITSCTRAYVTPGNTQIGGHQVARKTILYFFWGAFCAKYRRSVLNYHGMYDEQMP